MSKYRIYDPRLTPMLKAPLGIQMIQSTCLRMKPVQLVIFVTGQVHQAQMDYRRSWAETLRNYMEITPRRASKLCVYKCAMGILNFGKY
jgi:hypothetical protein